MKFNGKEFIIKELITNENGKNSGSGFAGLLIVIIGLLGFIAGVVAYFLGLPFAQDLIGSIIAMLGIGGGLLGVRKVWGNTPKEEEDLSA